MTLYLFASLCTQLLCHYGLLSMQSGIKTTTKKIFFSLFQSGSTTEIRIWLATGYSTQKLGLKGEFSPMSSWTGWRGSSLLRTWRSGLSMRSEFRLLMVLALGPGANQSMEGPGSPVRMEIHPYTSQKHVDMLKVC